MKIQVLTGADAGSAVEVDGDLYVVGRDPSCDLVLRDPDVAERHAAFERLAAGRYALHDLRSRNGTFLNGRRIKASVPLDGSEVIRLASTTLQLAPSRPGARRRPARGTAARRLPWAAIAAAIAIAVLGAIVAVILSGRSGSEVAVDVGAAPQATGGTGTERSEPASTAEAVTPVSSGAPAEASRGAGVIAFERLDGAEPHVVLVNPDGSGASALDAGPGGDTDPALSPDGELVAFLRSGDAGPFAGGGDARLYVVGRDGSRPEEVLGPTTIDPIASGPAWAPDGSRLAVATDAGGIAVVGLGGGQPSTLGSGRIEAAAWSPDGARIALAARVAPATVVVATVEADGSDPRPLATIQRFPRGQPAGLDWSPDGRRFALTCSVGRGASTRPAVCVMGPGGKKIKVLTPAGSANFSPSWSPDGGRIAFVSDRDGNDEIYVMHADGSKEQRVTSDPAPDRHPSWGGGAPVSAGAEAAPAVVTRDDFSDSGSGWEVFQNEGGGSARYLDGALVLSMRKAGYVATSDSGRTADRGEIAVTATRSSDTPKDASFGVVCGYRDQSNFFLLGVRADGTYAIARWRNRRETVLTAGGIWAPSSAIPAGGERYELRANCTPDRLGLSVNGRAVVSVPVQNTRGTFGLFVETYDKGGAEVRFDDLVVTEAPKRS